MIEFNCPECNKQTKARPELAGKTVKCPRCGNKIVVPQSSVLADVEKPNNATVRPQLVAKFAVQQIPAPYSYTQQPQPQLKTAIKENASSARASSSNVLAWLFGASTLVLVIVVVVLLVPSGVTTEKPLASTVQPGTNPRPAKSGDESGKKINTPLQELPLQELPLPRRATTSSKTDVPSPPPRVYKTGELAIAGGIGYSVVDSLWSNSISTNALMNTPPRAAYLIVSIIIINGNKEPYLLPPLKLLDENGTEYAQSHNDWMEKNSLKPVENLNPEVGLVGSIAFDVPKNHQYRLVVRGGMLSPERAYISLQPKEVSGQTHR